MNKMYVDSIYEGSWQINYRTKNSLGERIYYAWVWNGQTFELFRTCKLWEPQNRATTKVPLLDLFEIPRGNTDVEIRFRHFMRTGE